MSCRFCAKRGDEYCIPCREQQLKSAVKEFKLRYARMSPEQRKQVAIEKYCGIVGPVSWRVVNIEIEAGTQLSHEFVMMLKDTKKI